ncbi:LysR family transcriptional regulator [Pseudomonas sp. CAH-1]|jgi:DNA-binding transcriptional LysR family regulator|uniref:LysR family transcriptional regulator n=2 Tax=Pseudomonas TaxID=286 RepID=A0ABD7B7B1_PSEPU|nr:LysR family transcriptional regulator [Pseudomonas putida H8234]MBH3381535.1 LysR family transcriptional regulator [Pseudomonas asiatica]MBS3185198.1 LysR family transcriptional regulator [Pseudomonas sp. PCH44]MRT63639.1 LysR family transcriptional regulator [Pseudomonas sp. CAH-1]PIK75220.1 LysR family transcriptional regulator [Pseudomonas sp. 382]PPB16864.1 LysR family transcriptional regulator [Pseudomonas aeruginosa]QOC95449.1 LysR family transcriptional regulator [Pseudomonas putida
MLACQAKPVPSMKLDPVSLRLFVSVVEEGTIAAAAKREHFAAAAVSKRLSELEELLDSKLLNRTNKGITPTDAGLSLLFMARSALNNLNEIIVQMREFSHGRRGSVHVLANISAITQFLPDLIKSFMEQYPLINVRFEEKQSLAITKAVAENRADIGIFTRLPHGADIEVFPFRNDRLVLLIPLGHPLAARQSVRFSETLDHEYIALRSGTHLNFQLIKAANDLGRSLKIRMEVSSYDALCLMIQAGLGIGIMPEGSAAIYRMDGAKVVNLEEAWASRELSVCVRSQLALTVAARLFLEHLRESESA